MTVRTPGQAMAAARRTTKNVVGTCQKTVRGWYNAPSAGDQDGDGDADAVDGWKSEPEWAKHRGDRNAPDGAVLSFSGGSRGFGHRALAMVNGIRSTDTFGNRYSPGNTSTVTGASRSVQIANLENLMNVHYEGWSSTIDGEPIPGLAEKDKPKPKPPVKPKPKPPVKPAAKSRGKQVDAALDAAKQAQKLANTALKGGKSQPRAELLGKAQKSLDAAVKNLEAVPLLGAAKKTAAKKAPAKKAPAKKAAAKK